ncbi:MAG: hypothetical protein Q9162_001014 [Coniocarpon cinnabarinum]
MTASNASDDLDDASVGAADITKLKANGFYTVASVHSATRRQLSKIKGFSEAKVEKVKEAITKQLTPEIANGFMSAQQLGQQRKRVCKISTGSKQFDAILGGGFQTSSISELPREQGGGAGKAAYVDTEGTFRPERIQQIAERFEMDPDTTLENISYARAVNSEHQADLLNTLSASFTNNAYRLLIVDSIISNFRVDYAGRGELAERQQKLAQFLRRLENIASEFNVAVVITNQVQSDPGASALFASGPKPVGGHVLAHASATRVALRKGRGDERVAKVNDSPDMPEREATYVIGSGGIGDPSGS